MENANESPSPQNPGGTSPKTGIEALADGKPVQVILMQPTNAGIRRWMNWLGWALFFVTAIALLNVSTKYKSYFDTSFGISEKHFSGSTESSADKVAILSVTGVIADGSGFVKSQIDRIRDDENVKAVVVRVVSPGGTITGSDYIYHHLTKLRDDRELPIVVSMGSMAASGGYYVAMAVGDQEKSIFAEPTTTTGSIGVIIPHYDISGLMERYAVVDDSLATHPRKKMLSMTRPMSDDDRGVLTEYLNTAFDRFKEVVRAGRPALRNDPDKLDELATGEVFAAQKAQRLGLVDELGFIEDAIDRAIELAKLDKDSTRVVKYAAPPTIVDVIGLSSVRSSTSTQLPSSTVESILEFSIPQAYYLASTLPPLVSTFAK
jgi:protease-4